MCCVRRGAVHTSASVSVHGPLCVCVYARGCGTVQSKLAPDPHVGTSPAETAWGELSCHPNPSGGHCYGLSCSPRNSRWAQLATQVERRDVLSVDSWSCRTSTLTKEEETPELPLFAVGGCERGTIRKPGRNPHRNQALPAFHVSRPPSLWLCVTTAPTD